MNENTKFTFTIGKVITIVVTLAGTAFTVGMTYQQILPDKKIQEQQAQDVADLKITMARVTTILEKMEERSTEQHKAINDVQTKTSEMNVKLEVIDSYVKEAKNKRR